MKLAIFNYYGMDATIGGPRGYIYNLYSGYDELKENAPDFLYSQTRRADNTNKCVHLNTTVPSDLHCVLAFIKKGLQIKVEFKSKIREYAVIHTHSCEDCFYLRMFAGYKGKIILTSHRPEPLVEERLSLYKKVTGKKFTVVSKLYNYVETKAYEYADAFIFPSKGAMSIYNDFPGFSRFSKGKLIHYVMTGAPQKPINSNREEYRKKHNIAEEEFVISFLGRHNSIKGYDRVVNTFEKMKEEGIRVLVAGAPSADIEAPKDDMWTELGYIKDTADLMSASDVVVIPNRNTYYDLVIIEALSVGKIVISSNTGGNNDIGDYTDGLILFDNNNEKDFVEKVLEIKNMPIENRRRLEKDNVDFYNQHSTILKFAENYSRELTSICEEVF